MMDRLSRFVALLLRRSIRIGSLSLLEVGQVRTDKAMNWLFVNLLIIKVELRQLWLLLPSIDRAQMCHIVYYLRCRFDRLVGHRHVDLAAKRRRLFIVNSLVHLGGVLFIRMNTEELGRLLNFQGQVLGGSGVLKLALCLRLYRRRFWIIFVTWIWNLLIIVIEIESTEVWSWLKHAFLLQKGVIHHPNGALIEHHLRLIGRIVA